MVLPTSSPELTLQWEKCNESHAWHKIWNIVILLGGYAGAWSGGVRMHPHIYDNLGVTLTFTRSLSSPHSYPVTLMLYLCIIIQRPTDVVETSLLRNVKINSEILLSCFFFIRSSRKMLQLYLNTNDGPFRPYPSQFIIDCGMHCHRRVTTELRKLSYSCV